MCLTVTPSWLRASCAYCVYSQGTHGYIVKIKLQAKIWIVSWKSSSSILKPGGIWDLEASLDRMMCREAVSHSGKAHGACLAELRRSHFSLRVMDCKSHLSGQAQRTIWKMLYLICTFWGHWGKAGSFPQWMHLTTATVIRVQEESLREDVGMIKVFGNELFLTALEVTLLHLPNSYNARSTLLELIHFFSIHHSQVFFFSF